MNSKSILYRIAHWETWDPYLKYVPLIPAWLYNCARAGSFWFFTASNPTLTFGGFEGESKKEMYDQLPPGSYPQSIYISPDMHLETVLALLNENRLQYPVAVKPDVGMKGLLFRRINTIDNLKQYHRQMTVNYVIQAFVPYPVEVSVFYYRIPGSDKGAITGFIQKESLEVTGDGKKTLWQLMTAYPRVQFILDEMRLRHSKNLHDVIPGGETYCLSYANNLSRGAKLVSLEHENDDRLLKVFDGLSHYTKYFYYGRYDVKCASIEDLKAGKNFSILEFNGSGAEPHQIYGNGNTLFQAYKILLHHWSILCRISKHNRDSGVQYWPLNQGRVFLKEAKKHFRMLEKLDTELN